MYFLVRNLAVIALAVFIGSIAWMHGGTRGDLLVRFVPPLWVFLAEVMLCFPERHTGETLEEARLRVWYHFGGHPLVWLVGAFMVQLVIPFLNAGLCPVCDADAIALGAPAAPPVPFLPFCVNRLHHLNVFLWFLSAFSVMLGVKFALTKRGKRALLEALVWNGVALVAMGFLQQARGAVAPLFGSTPTGVYFFSVFGYANMGGSYFTALFLVSLAVWRRKAAEIRSEETLEHAGRKHNSASERFWAKNYILIASAALYCGAVLTLSRAAILLSTAGALIMMTHTAIGYLARRHGANRVRAAAMIAFVMVALAVVASVFMPASVKEELGTVGVTEALDRVSGKTEYHSRVALSIFAEHPLFGCGGWGYKHFSLPKTPDGVSKFFQYSWMKGGANVHNDYLQFLCEHGLVGVLLLLAVFISLLLPVSRIWRVLARSARFLPRREAPPSPRALFALPAEAFALLVAIAATLIHAFGDCPLRSAAVLTLLFAELASLEGFLPRIDYESEKGKK